MMNRRAKCSGSRTITLMWRE